MRKRVLKKAAFWAAALLFALNVTTCETLKDVFREPAVSFNSIYLTGISFTGLDLLCKVNIENPNPVTIPFPELTWEFFVNTNSFVKGVIKNDKSLKSKSATVVDVPLSVNFEELFKSFQSLLKANSADYRIALAAKFNLPLLGDTVFPLEHSGTFPVLKVPSLSFKGISVKNVSLTKLDFQLDWEVENTNSFSMTIKEFSYNFAVNNSRWVSGKIPDTPVLASARKTPVSLGFSLNSLSMVKSITGIITQGTDVNYTCGGNVTLGGDLPGLRDITLPFTYNGSTKLGR